MNKRERSWVLYDVGNSAFVMFASTVAPIYYGGLLAEGESVVVGWGYAETIVSLIVALLMPFLGSLADYPKNKKKFFIGAAGTGVIACSALSIPDEAKVFLIIYVIAAVGVNASMVFYDGFLADATEDERFDSVSSKGYAWGYVGSLIPFLICIVLIFKGEVIGIDMTLATKISFIIIALWWALFALPLIFNVHQTHFKPKQEHMLAATFKGLAHTVGHIVRDKRMLFFLLAFFCYIDGVHTIIRMATSYGTELGISSTDLIKALVLTQLIAFPSALVFGKLAGRVGTRIMLIVSVIAYALITLFAAFFLKGPTEFWILAVAVGLFQGGIQALSRSYFGKMVPKEHTNEYFGFFDIFGKYAAIIGTFMMAFFTDLTGNASMGILSLALLFILGLVFLILMPRSDADKEK